MRIRFEHVFDQRLGGVQRRRCGLLQCLPEARPRPRCQAVQQPHEAEAALQEGLRQRLGLGDGQGATTGITTQDADCRGGKKVTQIRRRMRQGPEMSGIMASWHHGLVCMHTLRRPRCKPALTLADVNPDFLASRLEPCSTRQRSNRSCRALEQIQTSLQ